MATEHSRTILAAGAVLWRRVAGGSSDVEVAVIHRPRYDDWSLPKGKVDPGEVEAVTAVREIAEETGFHARLGRYLLSVSYPVGSVGAGPRSGGSAPHSGPVGSVGAGSRSGGSAPPSEPVDQANKLVRYWAAEALDGEFRPNHEVDQLIWLPVETAMPLLDYPIDRKVLRRFTRYHLGAMLDTRNLLIVRHADAGRRSRYKGDDRKRPLSKRGRDQAEALVGLLLAFGATDLHAADRVRCHQTLEPLADALGVTIRNERTLTEEAYSAKPKPARKRVLDIAGKSGTRVICTQGKVIPDLVTWWCAGSGVEPAKSRNRKGSVWVLSLDGQSVVAADHIGSALAAQN